MTFYFYETQHYDELNGILSTRYEITTYSLEEKNENIKTIMEGKLDAPGLVYFTAIWDDGVQIWSRDLS